MYIDYGNTEWLKRERTVLLNDIFELRPQGVLVKLSGIKITLPVLNDFACCIFSVSHSAHDRYAVNVFKIYFF